MHIKDNILTLYCDESGFTGENLLYNGQPIFTYAAVSCDEVQTKLYIQELIQKYKIQTTELKGTNLITQRSGKGKKLILEVLEQYNGQYKVSLHNKKFALACKFFEYIFEPVIASQSVLFYKNSFHLFISNYLYMMFSADTRSAKEIFEQFEQAMRNRQFSLLEKLFSVDNIDADDKTTPMIIEFIKCNHIKIREELESVKKWTLDLTTTSLYTLLTQWNRGNEYSLQVYCDNSKPLDYDKKFFDCFIGRTEEVYSPVMKSPIPLTCNLLEPINMVDSKDKFSIQVADVISVAYAYSVQNDDDFAKKIQDYYPHHLSEVNIVPDFSYIDLTKPSVFLNAMILEELHIRSKNKLPLLENLSEYIREVNIQLVFNKPEDLLAQLN